MSSEKNSIFGPINKLKFTNFTLFGVNELNFDSGINILPFTTNGDNDTIDMIVNLFINPKLWNSNSYLLKEAIKSIKSNFKNNFNLIIEFYLCNILTDDNKRFFSHNDSDFNLKFLNIDKINCRSIITKDEQFALEMFDFKMNEWIKLSQKELTIWSSIIYEKFWFDLSFPSLFDFDFLSTLNNLSPTKFFDLILAVLDIKSLKNQYLELINEFQNILFNIQNVKVRLENSFITKANLESNLIIFNKIKDIDSNLQNINEELVWAPLIETENAIKSKKEKILMLESKKSSIKDLISEIEDNMTNLNESNFIKQEIQENLTEEYNIIRNQYLSEKHVLDQIERDLSDWDKSIKKTERDIKFNSMKLKDKNKKLNELEIRLNKEKFSGQLKIKNKELIKEIKELEKTHENYYEIFNGLNSENNRRLKDKSIKERKLKPFNSNLKEINQKLKKANDELLKNEENLSVCSQEKSESEKGLKNLIDEETRFNLEIKELKKKIKIQKKTPETMNTNRPQDVRSTHLLGSIKTNLIEEKKNLQNSLDVRDIEEKYSSHLKFMDSLDDENKFQKESLTKMESNLQIWIEQWNKLFANELNQLKLDVNNLLSERINNIEFELSNSILPDEGFVQVYFNLFEKGVSLNLFSEKNSSNKLLILNSLIFCLFLRSNVKFSYFNNLFFSINSKEHIINLFELYNSIENKKNGSKGFILPQIIISTNESTFKIISGLVGNFNINLIKKKQMIDINA